MKVAVAVGGAIVLTTASPAFAHRLDEYLQATTLSVASDRLRVDMRLAPGVAVASTVLDSIDTNRDGAISTIEEETYGRVVLADLALTLDGDRVPLRLVSERFDSVDDIKRGLGEMHIAFEADLPSGATHRRLVLENRHRSRISAYLVNALVPQERDIRITNQKRNYGQSVYELAYEQGSANTMSMSFGALLRWGLMLGGVVLVIVERIASLRRRRAAA